MANEDVGAFEMQIGQKTVSFWEKKSKHLREFVGWFVDTVFFFNLSICLPSFLVLPSDWL